MNPKVEVVDVEAIKREREEQAKRNRERMPAVAAMVDEFREVFGHDGVRLLWGKDLTTGVEVGKQSEGWRGERNHG